MIQPAISIRPATLADVPAILGFIKELAEYERAPNDVVATEADLVRDLFGERPCCEAIMGLVRETHDGPDVARGFALFFHNFSTWEGRRGLYLEDLFVKPGFRGRGVGALLMAHLAGLAVARGCARFEWSVLDWNTPAIGFYQSLGARVLDDWRVCRLDGDALTRLAELA